MHFRHSGVVLAMLSGLSCLLMGTSGAEARNHVVTVRGGEVHLRGALAEGSCVVSAESRDMQVSMGQYRNDTFHGVGSLSPVRVPFAIHLTDCNPSLVSDVGVSFYGMTDPKEADVFLVTSGDGAPTGVSGGEGYSGLGLMLSDESGRQVIPDQGTGTTVSVNASEVIMNYVARYRATSREVWPGALHSEVWFRLVYP
ncbi:fimbrial protein FimI [Enterobacter sp. 10-1]|uniref:fimbrial protein n=1 Tax=Raoultella sp. 10-1 TaxID=2683201 RepID=UPI000BA3CFDF|nr:MULTISPECIES: fimbrial protein [Enterobacteriaceae]MVT06071.1 fimbrial protein [Raoultella sp. 10-1]PAC07330.1 fimbrial protein FimI [Enterobacter sp. 10-1]